VRFLTKQVAQTKAPVADRDGDDLEAIIFQDYARFDLDEVNLDPRVCAFQHYAEDQVVYPIEGPAAAINLNVVDSLPPGKGGHQSSQPKDVIEVPVGEKNPAESLETQPAPKDLPLGTFSTINQKPIVLVKDHL
jgi:hypothetical protein